MKEVEPKVYTVKFSQEQIEALLEAFFLLGEIDEIVTDHAVISTNFAVKAFPAICDSIENAGYRARDLLGIE